MFEEIPKLVRLISVLDYLSAVVCFLLGASFFFGYNFIEWVLKKLPSLGILDISPDFNYGIMLIFISAFLFLIATGLWKGKNWARYTEIVLAICGFVIAGFFIFLGEKIFIFNLFFHGLVGGYLMFSRDVREAFY